MFTRYIVISHETGFFYYLNSIHCSVWVIRREPTTSNEKYVYINIRQRQKEGERTKERMFNAHNAMVKRYQQSTRATKLHTIHSHITRLPTQRYAVFRTLPLNDRNTVHIFLLDFSSNYFFQFPFSSLRLFFVFLSLARCSIRVSGCNSRALALQSYEISLNIKRPIGMKRKVGQLFRQFLCVSAYMEHVRLMILQRTTNHRRINYNNDYG